MYKKLIISLVLVSVVIWAWYLENNRLTNVADDELKERIGQMLIVGFRGTEITENSHFTELMEDVEVGGVILFDYDAPSKSFPRNITDAGQVKELISSLKKFSPKPLLIEVDAEGGLVNRLKEEYGFLTIPSPQSLGEKNNPEVTKKTIEFLAQELSLLGFNANFAPVVDVNVNPENPVIGKLERSFSADPEKVSEQAKAFIQAHHDYNIITSLKHFPGHGSSRNDSHLGMVDITETWTEEELIPYQQLIGEGLVDLIMTAHIMNRNIDPELPATLSPLFIQNILREQLGFQGVIVSDDMQMGAITEHYGFSEAIIKAINAGCDMLIISNNGSVYNEKAGYEARDIIFKAVKNGDIPIESINESFERIQNLKKQFGII